MNYAKKAIIIKGFVIHLSLALDVIVEVSIMALKIVRKKR